MLSWQKRMNCFWRIRDWIYFKWRENTNRVQFDWLRRHSWDDRHGSCPRFDRSLVDVDIAILHETLHPPLHSTRRSLPLSKCEACMPTENRRRMANLLSNFIRRIRDIILIIAILRIQITLVVNYTLNELAIPRIQQSLRSHSSFSSNTLSFVMWSSWRISKGISDSTSFCVFAFALVRSAIGPTFLPNANN